MDKVFGLNKSSIHHPSSIDQTTQNNSINMFHIDLRAMFKTAAGQLKCSTLINYHSQSDPTQNHADQHGNINVMLMQQEQQHSFISQNEH